jgi:transglutaminase-like putative cysteine protease
MFIAYGCDFKISVPAETHTVCLVDVHQDEACNVVASSVRCQLTPALPITTTVDEFGNVARRFTAPAGEIAIRLEGMYRADGGLDDRDPDAKVLPATDLPHECLPYLSPSRFCESDLLSGLAWNLFGTLPRDTRLVEAICDFTHNRLRFDYGQARATRTALEAYSEQVGVCRDFAHLAITFCRALNIPARYVNGYMGDIGVPPDPNPMDFNAWIEVFLGGRWTTFDPRHNCRRIGRIPIARGRDACDVPMIRTFGVHQLVSFTVTTQETDARRAAA